MGYFDSPLRWPSQSDFPSYDIQNMASIHVQTISKQQFYCLSVIIYLEYIKITFKTSKTFGFVISPVQFELPQVALNYKHTETNMPNVTLTLVNLSKLQKLDN